nr:hypothetical protein [Methanosarcina barkeri]
MHKKYFSKSYTVNGNFISQVIIISATEANSCGVEWKTAPFSTSS